MTLNESRVSRQRLVLSKQPKADGQPLGLKHDSVDQRSWLSLLPRRLNPEAIGLSRPLWQPTQVRTPGIARRRPFGMSPPHTPQNGSPSPLGILARAAITAFATVSSI